MHAIATRLRFTLAFLLVMVVAAAWAGTWHQPLPAGVLDRVGISLNGLLDGRFYLLVTAIFFSHGPGMLARQLLLVATIIGLSEWTRGSWRTLAWFFLLDIGGTLVLLFFMVWPTGLFSARETALELAETDVGMSGGGFGLAGMLIATLPPAARIAALVLLYAWLAWRLVVPGDQMADVLHLITLTAGLCAAIWMRPAPSRQAA